MNARTRNANIDAHQAAEIRDAADALLALIHDYGWSGVERDDATGRPHNIGMALVVLSELMAEETVRNQRIVRDAIV